LCRPNKKVLHKGGGQLTGIAYKTTSTHPLIVGSTGYINPTQEKEILTGGRYSPKGDKTPPGEVFMGQTKPPHPRKQNNRAERPSQTRGRERRKSERERQRAQKNRFRHRDSGRERKGLRIEGTTRDFRHNGEEEDIGGTTVRSREDVQRPRRKASRKASSPHHKNEHVTETPKQRKKNRRSDRRRAHAKERQIAEIETAQRRRHRNRASL